MSKDDSSLLWIGAFRYFCGRQTISVSSFCDCIIRDMGSIPKCAITVIRRDLREAIKDDDRDRITDDGHRRLGHDCDRAKWLEVFDAINK